MKSRNWLCTLNNIDELEIDPQEYLQRVASTKGVKYVIGQVEKAPTTGMMHL